MFWIFKKTNSIGIEDDFDRLQKKSAAICLFWVDTRVVNYSISDTTVGPFSVTHGEIKEKAETQGD